MKDQYVILTGAKNNAGDYLIKHRAKELFASLRPDRKIIDYNNWEPISDKQLAEINASRALLLTGGPALQEKMYPEMFPLVDDLKKIKVPIISMAIGWKGRTGKWQESYEYPLTQSSLELLQRINDSGFNSSVRDYHTLSVLNRHNLSNFTVTGCSALFSLKHINRGFNVNSPHTISMSLGVSFFKSKELSKTNKKLILEIRDQFPDSKFTIVFHHSTDPELYKNTHNPNLLLLKAQINLIKWLSTKNINWVDISDSAESMLNHYSKSDIHIGYRVHAHILMASLSKPTILIAEDGRGMALKEVIGGPVFDGCSNYISGVIGKVITKLGSSNKSLFEIKKTPKSIIQQMKYEIETNFPRISQQRNCIDQHFTIMKEFIKQLP